MAQWLTVRVLDHLPNVGSNPAIFFLRCIPITLNTKINRYFDFNLMAHIKGGKSLNYVFLVRSFFFPNYF